MQKSAQKFAEIEEELLMQRFHQGLHNLLSFLKRETSFCFIFSFLKRNCHNSLTSSVISPNFPELHGQGHLGP